MGRNGKKTKQSLPEKGLWASYRRRSKAFRISIPALGLVLLFSLATYGYHTYNEVHEPALPKLIQHADIPSQVGLTFQQSLAIKAPADLSVYPASRCAPLTKDWVSRENAQQGVALTMDDWANIDIAIPVGSVLWLDKTSVNCGETIGVHASLYETRSWNFERGKRTVEVLRVGWYQGSGAKLVWSSSPISLSARRIPFATGATRMIETHWPTTLSFRVGLDWTPGFYLVVTKSPSGRIEGVSPLIVRAPLGSSPLVLVHSTLTWAAYNLFGGRSLYFGPGNSAQQRNAERSRMVSMDRPILGSGGVHIQRDAISLVQYLEMEGFNVDQIADTDFDQWPSVAKSYNGLIYSGHAEYFTRRQFDATVAARNNGVNIAVFGGNTAYWQTRVEPSPTGPYRRVIVYRVAQDDPLTSPRDVTIQFSDRRINTPSNLITGGYTEGVHVYGALHPVDIPSWLRIPKDTQLPGWASDSEIEGVVHNKAEPPNVHIIFRGHMTLRDPASAAISRSGRIPIADTIWFTLPSGAAVFNAGVTLWSCDLLPSCSITRMSPQSRASLQEITKQVLTLWEQKQVGKILK